MKSALAARNTRFEVEEASHRVTEYTLYTGVFPGHTVYTMCAVVSACKSVLYTLYKVKNKQYCAVPRLIVVVTETLNPFTSHNIQYIRVG